MASFVIEGGPYILYTAQFTTKINTILYKKLFFYLHILLKHLFFHKKCVITSTLYKNQ